MKTKLLSTISLLILFSNCSEFRQVQKNGTWEEKLKAAMKYYEEEDYYRASLLFEEVIPIIKGSNEAEKAEFFFAYAQYQQGNYILSSYHFKNFYDVYSRSEYAEEAFYMYAYSMYLNSPDFKLEQNSTQEAIIAMQTFINRFPNSKYRDEASMAIDEMQKKLEKKAYLGAKLYYDLEMYQSAVVSFDNFRKDYPDSDYVEEAMFLRMDAQFDYALNSVVSKQRERIQEFLDMYQDYIDYFPESSYTKQAGKMYERALEELEQLNS